MKIGDYARTDDGLIRKIEKIERNAITTDISLNDYSSNLINRKYLEEIIIKSSPNIIDLIEVGDYVNGCLVLDIAQAPKKALYLLEKDNHCALIPRMNKDIKSIITKEQFKNMEYKLGSDKE